MKEFYNKVILGTALGRCIFTKSCTVIEKLILLLLIIVGLAPVVYLTIKG